MLLQSPAAAHGHAQAKLVRMPHLTFTCVEAVAQQHHRALIAGVNRRGLRAGFLQQLVGEGWHHGSGNGAVPPGMEWQHGAGVTS
ncbi:hypothetical protein SGMN_22240 [Stenotrophomonas geniculata]